MICLIEFFLVVGEMHWNAEAVKLSYTLPKAAPFVENHIFRLCGYSNQSSLHLHSCSLSGSSFLVNLWNITESTLEFCILIQLELYSTSMLVFMLMRRFKSLKILVFNGSKLKCSCDVETNFFLVFGSGQL